MSDDLNRLADQQQVSEESEPDAADVADGEARTDWDLAVEWMQRHWRAVLLIATALLLAVSCRDMHFNTDSVHYVDVARTILKDGTIGTWHLTLETQRIPETMLYWPPLYPVLLAALLGIGLSLHAAVWLIAVVAYSAVAWLMSCWLRRPALAIVGVIAFVHLAFLCGLPFRAWSEGPYMPLMVGSLVCVAYAVSATSSRRAWLLGLAAGAVAGLAVLTRYVALSIVPAFVLAAAMVPAADDDEDAGRWRWGAVTASLIGMILVVTPWLVRNVMLNGRLFGPERPPGERPLTELLTWLGLSVYAQFGAILLALLFAAIGYHALERLRDDGGERVGFLSALAGAGVACGLAHIIVTLLSYMLWQIDEPPTKRYFFPAYLCILVAGLAVMARARLPENVLARRTEIIVLLALPIVGAPLFVGRAAQDVTPPYTSLDQWIEQNTAENDLIVGHRAWGIRFHTGRPVLQSGQAADPPVSDGEKAADFLERFGDRFGDVYVVVSGELEHPLDRWHAAGLQTEKVATVLTRSHDYDRPGMTKMAIHRLRR